MNKLDELRSHLYEWTVELLANDDIPWQKECDSISAKVGDVRVHVGGNCHKPPQYDLYINGGLSWGRISMEFPLEDYGNRIASALGRRKLKLDGYNVNQD